MILIILLDVTSRQIFKVNAKLVADNFTSNVSDYVLMVKLPIDFYLILKTIVNKNDVTNLQL